jgi:prepilin-type N-terminal cleavage/methylation domain-containing protein/prepilin-type processing-associated H-X9-DG protein
MGRDGFSLLELLLVAAIILVLASLYFGPSAGSRQRALQAACEKNLQKLFVAMQIYATDSGGLYPKAPGARTSAEALDVLVPRYSSDTAVFVCPASDDSAAPAESLKKCKISYAYYMGRGVTNSADALVTDKQVDALVKNVGQPIFSSTGKPPGNNHGKLGGNLLFCDGHIESMPPTASAPLNLSQGEVLLNP